ncbi:nuclear transport factor 2 family protein [Chitinivorax sp. B]|uniref:nuclear transport factor 2 family protein n=1 Tax=Chitinivorax sp. B TaxID=2502235 RepID=UPI0010F8081A|nr:nuclear transport factor 2 family protein [Chitinivorax sp. B]
MTTPIAIVDQFLQHVFTGQIHAALALIHPEALIIPSRATPSPDNPLYGRFIGPSGMQTMLQHFASVLKPGQFDIQGRLCDGNQVALYGQLRHQSTATDKWFSSDWALIAKVEAGQLVHYHFYEDTAALESAIH